MLPDYFVNHVPGLYRMPSNDNTVQLVMSSRRCAFWRAMSDDDVDGVVDDAGAL